MSQEGQPDGGSGSRKSDTKVMAELIGCMSTILRYGGESWSVGRA